MPSSMSQTDWCLIDLAASGGEEREAAMEQLARRYWPAIYAFLRASGQSPSDAADLSQGFFCDVVLSRQLLATADPVRGRFRALLLRALQNYATDLNRGRRGNGVSSKLSRAEVDVETLEASLGPDEHPQDAFNRQWTATLVRNVLQSTREGCEADGLQPHWQVFELRVVRPMLRQEPAVSHEALAERLGLEDASQAANMMVTVKRRFARALLAEVRRTVSDPDDAPTEANELLRALEVLS